MFKVPNQYRVRTGAMGSDDSAGLCGAFRIPIIKPGTKYLKEYLGNHFKQPIMHVIADNGVALDTMWEHVSCYKTTGKTRWIPNWKEMCFIKDMFWDEEDCVIQYHPPKEDYVNCNPYVLHLWRPTNIEIPRPPKILVGV